MKRVLKFGVRLFYEIIATLLFLLLTIVPLLYMMAELQHEQRSIIWIVAIAIIVRDVLPIDQVGFHTAYIALAVAMVELVIIRLAIRWDIAQFVLDGICLDELSAKKADPDK